MEETNEYIASLLILHYGDLLKVSRVRGLKMPLPLLRQHIKENTEVIDLYKQYLQDEIEGMGLQDDAQLLALRDAQLDVLRSGDSKNNTSYADEVKKTISKGKADREEGQAVVQGGKQSNTDLVLKFLENPIDFDLELLTQADCEEARKILLESFEQFCLWAFYIQMGFKFQRQDFHSIIFEICQRVVDGELDRLIVNIPPRHSKTQILSIFLPLYSFCHNAGSHNIITSYAEDVVGESSGYIRTIMTHDAFSKIFPSVRIDPAKRSLERWGTTRQGVMHAVPTGGRMTGKGAGSLSPQYSGCFVIDDPIKPIDAHSAVKRSEVNDRYNNTFLSRLANGGCYQDDKGNEVACGRTPMILIMQRLQSDDLVAHLLKGNSPDKFHWLNIPAVLTEECGSEDWYARINAKQGYTHAIPVTYSLDMRGQKQRALWPSRVSLDALAKLQETDPYTYWSQYQGDPTAKGIGIINEDWWTEYDSIDFDKNIITRSFCIADTASTEKTYSDYSVLLHVGLGSDQKMYVLDASIGKWEAPKLRAEVHKFWNKVTKFDLTYPQMIPWNFYIEDKSSGHYLIQEIMHSGNIPVMPIPRDKTARDKLARFLTTVPYFAQRRILFPSCHEHLPHMRREILGLTELSSATGHDDVCDAVSDAVAVCFGAPSMDYNSWL